MNITVPINQRKMQSVWGADPSRSSYGRPIKKQKRRGRKADGKLKSWGLNRSGHRSNPRPKR